MMSSIWTQQISHKWPFASDHHLANPIGDLVPEQQPFFSCSWPGHRDKELGQNHSKGGLELADSLGGLLDFKNASETPCRGPRVGDHVSGTCQGPRVEDHVSGTTVQSLKQKKRSFMC